MVVAFDTSCMRGRFYDAGEVARELGYTEQLRRVHEGEWLLLKGYKGDEHALVMVLEGFEGRMGGMVGLGMFAFFKCCCGVLFSGFPFPPFLPYPSCLTSFSILPFPRLFTSHPSPTFPMFLCPKRLNSSQRSC